MNLGATDRGAEVTQLGATGRGAEVPAPLQRGNQLAPTWWGLGAVIFDRENFNFIRRSSRSRYSLSPPKFMRFHLVYCTRIFEI